MLQCLRLVTKQTPLPHTSVTYLFVAIAPRTILHWRSAVCFLIRQLVQGPPAVFQGKVWAKNFSPLGLVQSYQRVLVEGLKVDLIGCLPSLILKPVKLRICKRKKLTFLSIPHCGCDL